MKRTLLSLPDDVLGRVVKCLLLPTSSNSPFSAIMRPAISLSETCRRLRAVVVQQLHTVDFVTPSCYTSLCCRTSQSDSSRIESLIQSASQYLRVLHLPHGYTPHDAIYSALRTCVNLRELSLPVRKDLDSNQVHEFFSCFPSLEKLTLDLPTPQFLLGLCLSEICLTEVAFTKLPANTASLNALSTFLGRKGPYLDSLLVDVLAEDTKWNYTSSLRGSWVYHEVFMQQDQVIRRLSAILGRLYVEKKLSSLRMLDVSTIPGFPVGRPDEFFLMRNRSKIVQLRRAVKTAREENPQVKGLRKLRIRVPSEILNPSIAFMSPFVDPEVDVTFSFPDCTLRLPQNASNGNACSSELKEVLLGHRAFKNLDSWNSRSITLLLMDVGRENIGYIETITFGKHLSTIPAVILRQVMRAFVRCLIRFGRTSLKTVRFISNVPNTTALLNITTCLKGLDMAPTKLLEIELPADVVMFSAAMESLATTSGQFVTTLRISNFRDTTVLERVEETRTPRHHHISEGWITGSGQKAGWFLKGLPKFLPMLMFDFPRLETLYMEQTSATCSVDDQVAISRALEAIDCFERASKADASTLRTEILAWSGTPLPLRARFCKSL